MSATKSEPAVREILDSREAASAEQAAAWRSESKTNQRKQIVNVALQTLIAAIVMLGASVPISMRSSFSPIDR
jgi:hypothetical protein